MEPKNVVCTLFERSYHYGTAVLVNSLVRNGFRGRIIAGIRGDLPAWAQNCVGSGAGHQTMKVVEGCELTFVKVDTKVHLTNYKPAFLLDVLNRICPEAERIFYFDPDIVVFCRWAFFEEWVNCGVALCADVNSDMSSNHPTRNAWKRHFSELGLTFANSQNTYFNAGFIGFLRSHMEFVQLWDRLITASCSDLTVLTTGDRTGVFMTPDQDIMNAATMEAKVPLSTLGQDGMDFIPSGGGFVMSHAVGGRKPWNRSFLLNSLKGIRPGRAVSRFLEYADGPIHPYSKYELTAKRAKVLVAKVLARIFAG